MITPPVPPPSKSHRLRNWLIGMELNATTLNASETASGWLLFDLPSPHGKIVYAPNLDGQPLAYWKF